MRHPSNERGIPALIVTDGNELVLGSRNNELPMLRSAGRVIASKPNRGGFVSIGPTGCNEMKEVAIDVPIVYFIFLVAMEASRVIGQLQRTYRTLG